MIQTMSTRLCPTEKVCVNSYLKTITVGNRRTTSDIFDGLRDMEKKMRRPLMPNPEIPIAFIETFPLLVCPECKAEFVIIYWYGESRWGKQISTYYCPYCGKKWKEAKDA